MGAGSASGSGAGANTGANYMLAGSMTQVAAGFGTSYVNAQQAKAQAEYELGVSQSNQALAEIQARDVVTRGNKEAQLLKAKGQAMIGSQRTALAAQGIDIESGSALDVQADTAAQIDLDIITIRNNAWREAWGYKYQAAQYGFQGQMAALAGQNVARTSLITGGLGAFGGTTRAYGEYMNSRGKRKTGTSAEDIATNINDAPDGSYYRSVV
jgi:hypothetical protein